MQTYDDIASENLKAWNALAEEHGKYTRPWFDLCSEDVERFARGETVHLPHPWETFYPGEMIRDMKGKDVLCLASGGGQQSAVYGLLGANVTVLDLSDVQLERDKQAAAFHGYALELVHGDMRNLSCFSPDTFDAVYQAISICFVPHVKDVFREVYRVLRPGGLYRVGHTTCVLDEDQWDGSAFRVAEEYRPGRIEGADMREYRHLWSDMINGLVSTGFTVTGVYEDPRSFSDLPVEKGSEEHVLRCFPQYCAVMARK